MISSSNLSRSGSALIACGFFFLAACSSSSNGGGSGGTSSTSVSAIAISPSPCAVGKSDSRQMQALATLADGTKKDITSDSSASWSSANKDTATVSNTGNVVGVSAGVTKISITYGGADASLDCTVGF